MENASNDIERESKRRKIQPSSIPATSFYGTTATSTSNALHRERWASILEGIRELSKRTPSSFVVWEEFAKQEAAFGFQAAHPRSLHVFSYETDPENPGKRRFLVSTYGDFWNKYRQMKPTERHYYELVKEGVPCRLYMDIEFEYESNPTADGEEMIQILKHFIIEELQLQYNITCTMEDIVDLASSTPEKFSRHLIVHTSNAVFKDNSHVGSVVKTLMARILHHAHRHTTANTPTPQANTPPHHTRAHKLRVKDKDAQKLFIDDGVYSRNRNFRLWLSSKIGKNVVLSVADHSGRKPLSWKADGCELDPAEVEKDEQRFFMDSLVCAVAYQSGMRILTAKGLGGVGKREPDKPVFSGPDERIVSSWEPSPFPYIDDYIIQYIRNRTGSDKAEIKSCCYFPHSQTLVYGIVGDRFCSSIGRQHKSNGVYYVADLKTGVFNQRCHDPDCCHFRSADICIPLHLNPFSADSEAGNDIDLEGGITDAEILAIGDVVDGMLEMEGGKGDFADGSGGKNLA